MWFGLMAPANLAAKWRVAIVVTATCLATGACGGNVGPDGGGLEAIGVRAEGCGASPARGSGLVVGPGIILTSAHVVAGADTITVSSQTHPHATAVVVGFDPDMDLAYLRTTAPWAADAPSVDIAGEDDTNRIEAGTAGSALVFRDGQSVIIDVEVRRPITINTEDIYVEGETSRPGFELAADIELGDSGGAVIVDGRVVAVLWARSRRSAEGRSYAIDFERARYRIDAQLDSGDLGGGVNLSRC